MVGIRGSKFLQSKNNKDNRLVVFDVEGVILPKRQYLFLTASKHLDITGTFLIIILGLLYEIRLVSLEFALRKMYRLFRGIRLDELYQTFKAIPLIPGSLEVFQTLREEGYLTALISSGLPVSFVEDLKKRLGADYGYGIELETVDNRLTGEIKGDIVKTGAKASVLKELLNKTRTTKDDCVVVADDRNNLPMIPLCSKSIGYNSDFSFSRRATYIVKGGLAGIIPYIESTDGRPRSPPFSKNEYFRKTIHMGSYIIPLIGRYLGVDTIIEAAIISVTIIYIASELYRLEGRRIFLFSKITKRAVVGQEIWDFATDPVYFAMGIVLALIIFPKPCGYVAITVLTLGDGGATVFGKLLGRRVIPFNKPKTVEGTILGLLLAFIGSLAFTDSMRSLIAASVGALVEFTPSPVSDNISVPILAGLAITLL